MTRRPSTASCRRRAILRNGLLTGLAGLVMLALPAGPPPVAAAEQAVLRLATTTSTADTGLLDYLLPDFEKTHHCKVDVVAVGTGQALELGRRGDTDVLLVHNPKEEERFVAEGHARERFWVMYNDFVVVGPKDDPAHTAGLSSAAAAFQAIRQAGATFVSRGDNSGTHSKELSIWKGLGLTPGSDWSWYLAVGQGMGETLLFAQEKRAYTLSDRGTWLAMQAKLPDLAIVTGGKNLADNPDRQLRNFYGVMAVSPDKHPGVRYDLAEAFVDWLISPPVQERIGRFGAAKFGQSLFYPDSEELKATRTLTVISGKHRQVFELEALRKMPRESVAGYQAIGATKGLLVKHSWTGVNLKGLLLKVDPDLAKPAHQSQRIVITSTDGWTATLTWPEIFGEVRGGEALYRVKGCNECHGVSGEGTAPAGKRPAPALAGEKWPLDQTLAFLRQGGSAHAGVLPYPPEQLSEGELAQMLAWFADPDKPAGDYAIPAALRRVILADERDGRPITGRNGLLQLVVASDQGAGRFSHWVAKIEVK
jgi:tungstate transport system substrate-binding protein